MNPKQSYGRYQVIEEIGRGAMGVVYKAHDPRLKRTVALKVLRSDRIISNEYVMRFKQEARAIGQLSHPNIVNVFDQGEDQETLFMTMELVDGKSLRKVINERRLTHQDTIEIGVQVAEALAYAHDNGVIHRDIKPSNIIMLPDGQIKITDFGIARIEDPDATRRTQYGQILGTPSYMSPEQVAGEPLDKRSDLFSLGVILYEIVTGKKPFKGHNLASVSHAIIYDKPLSPNHVDSSIAPPLSNLIMKSLAKHPDQRIQTGQVMALELKNCLHRRTSDRGRRPAKQKGRQLKITAAATLLILSLLTLGAIYYHISQPPPQLSAKVKIDSHPSNAQVFIDGILKGSTPLTTDLYLGKHEVRISKPNYHNWEVQVNLDEEGDVPLFAELLSIEAEALNPD